MISKNLALTAEKQVFCMRAQTRTKNVTFIHSSMGIGATRPTLILYLTVLDPVCRV